MPSLIPDNEKDRLDSLASYEILDTRPEQEYNDLVEFAAEIFKVPLASISLVDSDRVWFKAQKGYGVDQVPRDFTFCSQAILGSKPLLIQNTRAEAENAKTGIVTNAPYIHFYMGVPLISEDGYCIGTLSVANTEPLKPGKFQKQALVHIAQCCCTLLELRRARLQLENQQKLTDGYREQITAMNAEIANLSRTDTLTGLWNHKSLVYELGKELSRSRRTGSTFALLKLNLDKFSQINDKHGRNYADESLRSVGNLLKDATRDTDVCSRFGGDEFMILMPNTDRAKANLVANRIKTSLRNMDGLFEPVTASIGVAVVLAAQASVDDILDLANKSMLNAKQQGGNTIEIDAFYGA